MFACATLLGSGDSSRSTFDAFVGQREGQLTCGSLAMWVTVGTSAVTARDPRYLSSPTQIFLMRTRHCVS